MYPNNNSLAQKNGNFIRTICCLSYCWAKWCSGDFNQWRIYILFNLLSFYVQSWSEVALWNQLKDQLNLFLSLEPCLDLGECQFASVSFTHGSDRRMACSTVQDTCCFFLTSNLAGKTQREIEHIHIHQTYNHPSLSRHRPHQQCRSGMLTALAMIDTAPGTTQIIPTEHSAHTSLQFV